MIINKNLFKLHTLVQILLFLISIWLISFYLSYDIILCEGDGEKFNQAVQTAQTQTQTYASQTTNNYNPYVSGSQTGYGNGNGNNANVQVQNPSLHIHNSDINIPSNWGRDVKTAAGYGSAGVAVAAGMNSMSRRLGSMPPAARAAWIGGTGAMGGVLYVGTNYFNTRAQRSLEPSDYNYTSNNNNSSNNGSFSPNSNTGASSMIEEGDSINTIMNFLYINMFLGACILLLLILLIYLYKNHKSITKIFVAWAFLVIVSMISVYFAYNLVRDIDIIAQIYQNNTSLSVVNYNTINPSTNEVKETKEFLMTLLSLKCLILFLLYLLLGQYLSTKIINEKWDLTFIKRIFGERFYYYFMKIYTYGSKTNEAWLLFGWIILVVGSLGYIVLLYYFIKNIDLITELYQYTKNSTNYMNNVKPNNDINTLKEMVVYFGYKIYILLKNIFDNK